MIGYITFDGGSAEVSNSLRWMSDDPVIQRYLSATFPLDDISPADGRPGYRQLYEASRSFSGSEVHLGPVPKVKKVRGGTDGAETPPARNRQVGNWLPLVDSIVEPGTDEVANVSDCGTGSGGFKKGNVCARRGAGQELASATEQEVVAKLARSKIRNAPVPSAEDVAKSRKELKLAAEGAARAGGESRGGSAASRRKQRENLFDEFGGRERGYVVCPWTGLKMHWTDDPKSNPKGYPKFERGKIFVKCQGGGYQLANLIPESFTANRSRNDRRLRKENSRGC